MGNRYVLGVDLGTLSGFGMLFEDGSVKCYAAKLKNDFAGRLDGLAAEIAKHATPDCMGVVIEKPFASMMHNRDVMLGMFGVAVHTCDRLGLPWYPLNVMTSKKHATGKGNAKKPDMIAAAKARWGVDMGPDEADACHAAAYGMDNDLFKA